MRVVAIVGPTRSLTYSMHDVVPPIDDQINDKIAELEAQGARDIVVDVKPIDRDWHLGTITYDGTLARAKAETFTIQQVADGLGVSRSTVQEHIRCGEIHAIHMGRRWLVPVAEYRRLLAATP